MGASQATVVRIYAVQLLGLAVLGGAFGSLLGYLAQYGLAALVGGMLVGALPPPGPAPRLIPGPGTPRAPRRALDTAYRR